MAYRKGRYIQLHSACVTKTMIPSYMNHLEVYWSYDPRLLHDQASFERVSISHPLQRPETIRCQPNQRPSPRYDEPDWKYQDMCSRQHKGHFPRCDGSDSSVDSRIRSCKVGYDYRLRKDTGEEGSLVDGDVCTDESSRLVGRGSRKRENWHDEGFELGTI